VCTQSKNAKLKKDYLTKELGLRATVIYM